MSDDNAARIAALIDGADAFSPDQGTAPEATRRYVPASPRAWGFDVDDINRNHALVLMGSRAVVVKERPDGPIEDRVRFLSLEAFYAWFGNCFTEVVGADGKTKVITLGQGVGVRPSPPAVRQH